MRFIRPKIIGTLKIQKMMNGNYAVINDIKSTPNKIIIPCKSKEDGISIIERIQNSEPGETIYI